MKRAKIKYTPAGWPIIKGYGPAPTAREYSEWVRRAAEGDEDAKREIDRYRAALQKQESE